MARDILTDAFMVLRKGLLGFVEQQLQPLHGANWEQVVRGGSFQHSGRPRDADVAQLLNIIAREWSVFQGKLRPADRAYVHELRDVRNDWAHQQPIGREDIARALDTMLRLLRDVGAEPEATELNTLRGEVRLEMNGLVRISRSEHDGFHDELLEYEQTWKEGNFLKFKCYDAHGVVFIEVHVDVVVEAAFGDVTPGHGIFDDEDAR